MTQSEVDRAVATATGEEMLDVRRMGFSIADPIDVSFDPEPYYPPQLVDWDEVELNRNVAVFEQRHLSKTRDIEEGGIREHDHIKGHKQVTELNLADHS